MAKPYNFMTNAEYSVYSYGILIKPFAGTVETVWKVPAKYQELAEKHIHSHYGNAIHPAIEMDVMGNVTFNRHIDYKGMFDDLEHRSNLDKYNRVIVKRDDAINDACFRLQKDKESFQDMIRGMFYTQRYIDNAPSIP